MNKNNEENLCKLEVRSLFHNDLETFVLESEINIDPIRSPFIKDKIEILFKCDFFEERLKKLRKYHH